jgi:hypothetical protein
MIGGGGEIVFAGAPEEIVRVERSYTRKFLAPVLGRKQIGAGPGDAAREPSAARRKKAAG